MASGKGRSAKDKAMASYLKDRGVKRNSQRCPHGCGNTHVVDIVQHLNTCKGARRSLGKRKVSSDKPNSDKAA